MIRDWWISIRFVCFVFQGSLLCDRPVSGNNRLVKFASQIFLIFLILVTWKNKSTSASFVILGSPESFSANPGEHVTLWFPLTLPSLKWLTEQKNPKFLRSLQYEQGDTTNYAVNCIGIFLLLIWRKLSFEDTFCLGHLNNLVNCGVSTLCSKPTLNPVLLLPGSSKFLNTRMKTIYHVASSYLSFLVLAQIVRQGHTTQKIRTTFSLMYSFRDDNVTDVLRFEIHLSSTVSAFD